MSHAFAEIIHDGKVIGYSEYNGTVDAMAWSSWYDTLEEVNENWRDKTDREWPKICSCQPTEIIIYTDYGRGFHWHAPACLTHRVIIDNMEPWSEVDCFKRDHRCTHSPTICSECKKYRALRPVDGHPLRLPAHQS